MKIDIDIPSLAIYDTIIGGVEGGIGYWAQVLQWSVPARGCPQDPTDADARIVCDIRDRQTGVAYSLQGKWADAVRLMAEKHPRLFAQILTGHFDAATGDVLYAWVVVMRSRAAMSANP
jgi:hypothetical protein